MKFQTRLVSLGNWEGGQVVNITCKEDFKVWVKSLRPWCRSSQYFPGLPFQDIQRAHLKNVLLLWSRKTKPIPKQPSFSFEDSDIRTVPHCLRRSLSPHQKNAKKPFKNSFISNSKDVHSQPSSLRIKTCEQFFSVTVSFSRMQVPNYDILSQGRETTIHHTNTEKVTYARIEPESVEQYDTTDGCNMKNDRRPKRSTASLTVHFRIHLPCRYRHGTLLFGNTFGREGIIKWCYRI